MKALATHAHAILVGLKELHVVTTTAGHDDTSDLWAGAILDRKHFIPDDGQDPDTLELGGSITAPPLDLSEDEAK